VAIFCDLGGRTIGFLGFFITTAGGRRRES